MLPKTALGQSRSVGDVGSMSGLPESGLINSSDSDLINVGIGPLCGLKSDISRGQRSAINGHGCIRLTGRYGISTANRPHSGLMLAALITLPHFSVSAVMSFAKSPGEPGKAVPPSSVSRALILESARLALIS